MCGGRDRVVGVSESLGKDAWRGLQRRRAGSDQKEKASKALLA